MTHHVVSDLVPWWTHPITVVDCETTGVDAEENRIIEVGAVRFERGVPVARYSTLISGAPEVSAEITEITGIRAEDLVGAPPFYLAVPELYRLARGSCVAAFNASFDQAFYLAELQRSGLTLDGPLFDDQAVWLDPLVWVRRFDQYVKGKGRHKLGAVCERYGIAFEGAHRADADAEAAGRVLFKLREKIGAATLSETLRLQRGLAAFQEREYQEYRARMDAKDAKDKAAADTTDDIPF